MTGHFPLHMLVIAVVLAIMVGSTLLTMLILLLLYSLGWLKVLADSQVALPLTSLLVSVIIGTVIATALSKRIIAPVRRVIEAMKNVSQGDFSPRVPGERARGELRDLIDGFNGMAEELGGIEMLRQDFINTFSHEFKTPIISIKGFAKQLKNPDLPEETRREYIDIIVSESENLTNMSSNILLLSRFENQEIITEKEHFRIDEQIRECILLLEKKWDKKNILFSLALPAVSYHGNREMTAHIWRNLLDNAIKFSHNGGEITVSATTDNGRVRVKITDRGIGMDTETLRRLYEKFYQGDASHATEGNGLGLPLVKQIVELCGGTIQVSSAPGKGTTFIVTL